MLPLSRKVPSINKRTNSTLHIKAEVQTLWTVCSASLVTNEHLSVLSSFSAHTGRSWMFWSETFAGHSASKTAFKTVSVTIFQLSAREGKGGRQDHHLCHLTKATNTSGGSWSFLIKDPTSFWTLNRRYLVCGDPHSLSYKDVTELVDVPHDQKEALQ